MVRVRGFPANNVKAGKHIRERTASRRSAYVNSRVYDVRDQAFSNNLGKCRG